MEKSFSAAPEHGKFEAGNAAIADLIQKKIEELRSQYTVANRELMDKYIEI